MLATVAAILITGASVQTDPERLMKLGLSELRAFALLHDLTQNVGNRVSGSANAAKAVAWGQRTMHELGFDGVRLQKVMVPHWERGNTERAAIVTGTPMPLSVCALGGSAPAAGVEAEVIEVKSLAEATALGERAKGKILFFNRPMDPTQVSTFAAYGGANDQRTRGPATASRLGAVGALVRSMTLADDDVPHTGATIFPAGSSPIPAAALGVHSAEALSKTIREHPSTKVRLDLSCMTYPDAESANVIGEIVGSEFPNEIVVMGGHLDSWDIGQGAHDDGAGVTQSLEALRLIKACGLKPKRTIRVVLFMNEENGGRGGTKYAEEAPVGGKKHIAAIESDSGGFMPRSFGVTGSTATLAKVRSWLDVLRPAGIERIDEGGGGADVGPLRASGTVTIGLEPDGQRYFDYHHSAKDTLDKVNARELEFGAIAMAILAFQLASEGIAG